MQLGVRIDYEVLRRINPKAGRRAVLEYLTSCNHNVAQTSGPSGSPVLRYMPFSAGHGRGIWQNRPKTLHRQPRKTPHQVEERVVNVRNRTTLGPRRLA